MTPIILEMVNTPAFCLSIQPILSLCTSRHIAVIALGRWRRCFPIQFQSMKAILHFTLFTVLILLGRGSEFDGVVHYLDAVLMPLYTYICHLPTRTHYSACRFIHKPHSPHCNPPTHRSLSLTLSFFSGYSLYLIYPPYDTLLIFTILYFTYGRCTMVHLTLTGSLLGQSFIFHHFLFIVPTITYAGQWFNAILTKHKIYIGIKYGFCFWC